MDSNYLKEYKQMKAKVKETLSTVWFREQVIRRQVTVNYFDSGNISKIIMKDTEKNLLTCDPESGCIIIQLGRFVIVPQQFIYGTQPFLHVEYKVRALLLRIGAIVKCKVTGHAKGRTSGEVLDRIPAIIADKSSETTEVGKTIKVVIHGLMPVKKGPCALFCKRVNSKDKAE